MAQAGARRFFFLCTDQAVNRMSELFDFVWPSVTALAFARSKAYRYRDLVKEERRQALIKAFQSARVLRPQYRSIPGLKRASLGKAFLDTGWSQQEQVFAQLVLVNLFAIHEGWLDDLMDEMMPARKTADAWPRRFITACQFPYKNRRHEDWNWAMSELALSRSADLDVCFGVKLRNAALYSQQPITLLQCYRYFKELRNSVAHRNGKATQLLVDAYHAYNMSSASSSLKIKGSPPVGTLNAVSLGSDIQLSLFGIVGFNDVVLRLMATLDAEVALTNFGEGTMTRFFSSRTNLPSSSGRRESTLRRMANEYGLFGLKHPVQFAQILTRNRITIP